MFEKYTGTARRVIFFARYEASQFGAQAIEAEHILLGLLREDKGLTNRFFPRPQGSTESIRKEIEGRTVVREKVSTSVDLPLSQTAKRVLSYAQEESERLQHRYIGTEHLLLGLLREEKSLAAEILYARGLRVDTVRGEVARPAAGAFEGDTRVGFGLAVADGVGRARPKAVAGGVASGIRALLGRLWGGEYCHYLVPLDAQSANAGRVDRWLKVMGAEPVGGGVFVLRSPNGPESAALVRGIAAALVSAERQAGNGTIRVLVLGPVGYEVVGGESVNGDGSAGGEQ
jgi:hypothetical protein